MRTDCLGKGCRLGVGYNLYGGGLLTAKLDKGDRNRGDFVMSEVAVGILGSSRFLVRRLTTAKNINRINIKYNTLSIKTKSKRDNGKKR